MTATIIDILTVTLLVIIAVELVLLRHDLTVMALRRGAGTGPVDEKKESPSLQPQTPMFNFNVGTPVGKEAEPEPPKPPLAPKPAAPPEADSEPSEPPFQAKREAAPPSGQSRTSSGLVANKCHKCGSENSSYRTECYNCGTQLK